MLYDRTTFVQLSRNIVIINAKLYEYIKRTKNERKTITLRISKGFLVSAGMMAPISDTGNRGSSIVPSVYMRQKVEMKNLTP